MDSANANANWSSTSERVGSFTAPATYRLVFTPSPISVPLSCNVPSGILLGAIWNHIQIRRQSISNHSIIRKLIIRMMLRLLLRLVIIIEYESAKSMAIKTCADGDRLYPYLLVFISTGMGSVLHGGRDLPSYMTCRIKYNDLVRTLVLIIARLTNNGIRLAWEQGPW